MLTFSVAIYIHLCVKVKLPPITITPVVSPSLSIGAARQRNVTSTSGYRHSHTSVDSIVRVKVDGNFSHRVAAFNAFLLTLREEELRRRETGAWKAPTSGRLELLRGTRDDYLQMLSDYGNVKTVALPWLNGSRRVWNSLEDRSNLPLQTYFEWTADDTLCSWIETPGQTKAKYDLLYNRTCNRDMNDTLRPRSLRPLFLNRRPKYRKNITTYPAHFFTDTPPFAYFMHIHRDAFVSPVGDVIGEGYKLVPVGCNSNGNPSLPRNLNDAVRRTLRCQPVLGLERFPSHDRNCAESCAVRRLFESQPGNSHFGAGTGRPPGGAFANYRSRQSASRDRKRAR